MAQSQNDCEPGWEFFEQASSCINPSFICNGQSLELRLCNRFMSSITCDEDQTCFVNNNEQGCTSNGELCNQLGDEDGNGLADCDDPLCASQPQCRVGLCENCGGFRQCEEGYACLGSNADDRFCSPYCQTNDDCPAGENWTCASEGFCVNIETQCSVSGDAVENSMCGVTYLTNECPSSESCVEGPSRTRCEPNGVEICDIAGDEDNDGTFDCDDSDCSQHSFCGGQIVPPTLSLRETCDTDLDCSGGKRCSRDGECYTP